MGKRQSRLGLVAICKLSPVSYTHLDVYKRQEDVFSDVAKLMELNAEKQSIAGQLEELYEKWEELAED